VLQLFCEPTVPARKTCRESRRRQRSYRAPPCASNLTQESVHHPHCSLLFKMPMGGAREGQAIAMEASVLPVTREAN
jgi:hypothetical protein